MRATSIAAGWTNASRFSVTVCVHFFSKYPLVERVTFEDVEFASSRAQGQLFATPPIGSLVRGTGSNTTALHRVRSRSFCGTRACREVGHGRCSRKDPLYEGKFRYQWNGLPSSRGAGGGDDEVDALALLHFTASVDFWRCSVAVFTDP